MSEQQRVNDPWRRVNLNRMEPSELAIRNAITAVEELGADERLSQAVVLLGEAKELVGDYIDGEKQAEREGALRRWWAVTRAQAGKVMAFIDPAGRLK